MLSGVLCLRDGGKVERWKGAAHVAVSAAWLGGRSRKWIAGKLIIARFCGWRWTRLVGRMTGTGWIRSAQADGLLFRFFALSQ